MSPMNRITAYRDARNGLILHIVLSGLADTLRNASQPIKCCPRESFRFALWLRSRLPHLCWQCPSGCRWPISCRLHFSCSDRRLASVGGVCFIRQSKHLKANRGNLCWTDVSAPSASNSSNSQEVWCLVYCTSRNVGEYEMKAGIRMMMKIAHMQILLLKHKYNMRLQSRQSRWSVGPVRQHLANEPCA